MSDILKADETALLAFNATPTTTPEKAGGGVPYFGIFGAKTKEPTRSALLAAGIEQNQFYVNDGLEPLRVVPFTCHLLRYARYYTTQNQKMELTSVRSESTDALFKQGYREHIHVLAAVRVGTGFIPAVGSFRGGMVDGFRKAIELVELAANPTAWAARSQAHAESIVPEQHPGGRVVLTLFAKTEKTNDGDEFNLSVGHTRPTPRAEAEAFADWFAACKPSILRAAGVFNKRVDECNELLGK